MMMAGVIAAAVLILLLVAGADGVDDDEYEQFGWASRSRATNETDGDCGYGDNAAKNVPFTGLQVAGLGGDNTNCGVCYRVICTHDACSIRGVRVTVIDDGCRGGPCTTPNSNYIFEMTDYAFDMMAQPGRAGELLENSTRNGVVRARMQFKREDCYYSPMPPLYKFPAFRVHPDSTKENFAVTVVFIEGMADGNSVTVQIMNAGEHPGWSKMTWVGGATWKYTSLNMSLVPLPVTAPISMQVSMPWLSSRRPQVEEIIAYDVIPVDWQPGQTYYPA